MSTITSGRGSGDGIAPIASSSHQQWRYTRPAPYPQRYNNYAPTTAIPSPPYIPGMSKTSNQGSPFHHAPPLTPRYHPRATIVIIGMRGAGKTTLGLIADRALGKSLIDADQIFQKLENQSIESFVASQGWPAFREKEATIIKDLFAKYPYDSIIACGSGIIETEESRDILIEARKTMPIINLIREREAVLGHLRALESANQLPEYGEDAEILIRRRDPLYRQCASHLFFNLTCDHQEAQLPQGNSSRSNKSTAVYPLKFKQVGESFLRLVRHILGDARRPYSRPGSRPVSRPSSPDVNFATHSRGSLSHLLSSHGPGPDNSFDRYSSSTLSPHIHSNPPPLAHLQLPELPRKADPTSRASLLTRRTAAICPTFPDLTEVKPSTIKEIVQGVDAIEVRVDLLACLRPASHAVRSQNPLMEPVIDFSELARQLETIRKMAPGLPILFTLRSDREGGCFFDDRNRNQRHMASPFSQALYFQILELGIATGSELLDVEMGWDPDLTRKFIEGRERTKIVVSYHDLKGALQWDTDVPKKLYQRATREFGSGVHLVELIGSASRSHIEQNSHLTSFAAKVNSEAAADRFSSLPPLMALNMQVAGRSSRPFNDVLSFISHPALPRAAGPGQMSLKETMESLVRFGIYQPCHFHTLAPGPTAEVELVHRALQIAFEEFGLPYDVYSLPKTDSLDVYLRQNKEGREGTLEWQGETADDRSGGLFLGSCSLADQQKHLFDLMDQRYSSHLTLSARVVRGVDVMARQDISQSLLGTEHGRRVPNALGDVRGPLIGCHTLPSSVYRVLGAHTAPINAPGIHASALVVILKPSTRSSHEIAAIDIAARSSLFAMAKLGFGEVYVLEEEKGYMESIIGEVLQLIRLSTNDVLEDVPFEHANTETNRCHFAAIETHQLGEPEGKSHGSDSIRKPRAIVIVGGSGEKQEEMIQTLWKPKSEEVGDKMMLPKETWDTLFGGTILRIPSVSSTQFGQQVERQGQEVEPGVTWERGGWIHVAPWVLDRDRVQKRVVEPWCRRGAPIHSMQKGWQ